jgi:hypothetical protein
MSLVPCSQSLFPGALIVPKWASDPLASDPLTGQNRTGQDALPPLSLCLSLPLLSCSLRIERERDINYLHHKLKMKQARGTRTPPN